MRPGGCAGPRHGPFGDHPQALGRSATRDRLPQDGLGHRVTAHRQAPVVPPRQNTLTRALQGYGRLIKTIFILRYLEDEAFRRRIGVQLNKGEAMHALRNFLFLANQGQIRRRTLEDQTNQAQCLNLVTNAVVLWNTVYMGRVIEQLRAEGHAFSDGDVAHLSPARFEHINPYGRYHFDPLLAQPRRPLRSLRRSTLEPGGVGMIG